MHEYAPPIEESVRRKKRKIVNMISLRLYTAENPASRLLGQRKVLGRVIGSSGWWVAASEYILCAVNFAFLACLISHSIWIDEKVVSVTVDLRKESLANDSMSTKEDLDSSVRSGSFDIHLPPFLLQEETSGQLQVWMGVRMEYQKTRNDDRE